MDLASDSLPIENNVMGKNLRSPASKPKRRSLWSDAFRRFRQNRGAMTGLVIILILIVGALTAPWITQYDPLKQNLRDALLPPFTEHLFGTDQLGRDVFTRVVYGARISLGVGIIATSISVLIGIPLGILAAYHLGWLDVVIMRLVDVLLAFPGLLLALAIMTVLGTGLTNAVIAVGIFHIPDYIRVTRGMALTIKQMEYVTAARAVGVYNWQIMVRHIFPNTLLPLIVLTTLDIAGAILFISSLSFLGLGAQPPTPEWGAMLTTGRGFAVDAWWLPVFPGLAIMVTVLAMNLMGDGLRDALDPRFIVGK